jgi:4-hydroxy-2-oxoheptanedioate aldolase
MKSTNEKRWGDLDQLIVNGWLSIPDAHASETMAQAGWDSLTVDMQHGIHDYRSLVDCIRAVELHSVFPMVRVVSNATGDIGKALDAGAWGVICPMINTKEDARSFVSACRYPPQGQRSYGPVRAAIYSEPGTYHQSANTRVRCVVMIETRQALENLEAILDVPGVDAVYVGPGDLGFSLGYGPKLDREEPEIIDIFERVIRETHRRGIRAGLHTGSPQYAVRAYAMGFRLLTVGSDAGFMMSGARNSVHTMHVTCGREGETS